MQKNQPSDHVPPFVRRDPTGARRRLAAAVLTGLAAVAAVVLPFTAEGPAPVARAEGVPLEADEVNEIITRVVHYAGRVGGQPKLSIAVVDIEGNALGVYHMAGVPGPGALKVTDPNTRERRTSRALSKAGTAAYFSSDEESFTTRTAAFIIQDHFPPGVRFAPAGPLYGVEFSNLGTSDVNTVAYPVPASLFPVPATRPGLRFEVRIRGDLGGVGLFKFGKRVGGLGVDDGDPDSLISIPDSVLFGGDCDQPYRVTHSNIEHGRAMERIVLAAAGPHLPPAKLRATEITVDGIRLPFARPANLAFSPAPPLTSGGFDASYPLRGAADIPSRFVGVTLDPPPGSGPGQRSYRGEMPVAFPVRDGTDGILTADDVRKMLWQGARRAAITRGAIRRPIGLAMQCWISVVDTNGEVLGVFRFKEDATMFSYDVAVQKARTAMFFSDEKVAWSCRGIGLFSQAFYPAGQQGRYEGPLFQLQDGISVGLLTNGIPLDGFPLRNGITIFPGGVPVYRNGQVAGGVGVSGDGIDQDDIVAYHAAEGYGARGAIRCDEVSGDALNASLLRVVSKLEDLVPADPGTCNVGAGVDKVGLTFLHDKLRDCKRRLRTTPFVIGTSYVKFPRHPGPVTVR